MKQLFSLLKATMSQDMDMFKYKAGKGSSKIKKALFPVILALIFMYAIGSYYYLIADGLSKINLTYIMLSLALLVPCAFTLIEGIYKSQAILFEAKDSELLFSLPIKKSQIVFARLFKFLTFQYLYNLLFILPAFIVYIFFEQPGVVFYLLSLLMTFVIPIIPTIISSFIGFLVKKISVKFKRGKLIQTFLTLAIFLVIFISSYSVNNMLECITNNALEINNTISHIYYPIGLYINLVRKFNFMDLVKLILINLVPLILFVAIVSKYYFSIVSKSSEKATKVNQKRETKTVIKQRSTLRALIHKELKKYTSTPVYMINTIIGVSLLLIATIGISMNFSGTIDFIANGEEIGINLGEVLSILPKIFFCLVIGTSCLSSITSSSISLEGKSFNITKSLPVKTETILLAKVLTSNLILMPLMFLSDIIYFVSFKNEVFDVISITLATLFMPTLIAIIGLFFNLKYPKMDATSDAEVVKQSTSSMLSVLSGILIALALIAGLVVTSDLVGTNVAIALELLIIIFAAITLWKILCKYAQKRFLEI